MAKYVESSELVQLVYLSNLSLKMDSLPTIDDSDPFLEETSLLQAPTHITADDGELDLSDAPTSPYVLETSFEDAPSSPMSSSDSEYNDDSDDDFCEDGVLNKSNRKYRGKNLAWVDHLSNSKTDFVMYEDLNKVISDAAKMNYSKASSSSIDVHIYKCKHRGCQYKRKYCRIALGSYFVSYFYGNHEHGNPAIKDDHRGLTGSQKIIIQEAMDNKRKSAKEILHYFRSKRTKILDELLLRDFPQDPNIIKLNNYIQSFKKKNAKLYNPTPTDVKNWCDSHGPSR